MHSKRGVGMQQCDKTAVGLFKETEIEANTHTGTHTGPTYTKMNCPWTPSCLIPFYGRHDLS